MPTTPERVSSEHGHAGSLRQGFAWLGGATALARVIDVSTTLLLLTLLTKKQVGVASLVISFAMMLEALNGLGTGEALIQARAASRLQLDTLFWYVLGAALLTGGLTVLAAPLIGQLYGVGEMVPFFLVIAAKQPLVGAALVPLAMMSRDLQYRRIAVVNLCATLGAALTRLALGAAGAGAWALVIGYSASGLYTLTAAMLARPFVPRLRFRIPAVATLTRFGLRAAAANFTEQMFKNVDYLLIGWFYGTANLAVYRVAFDVAMEPAMAIGTVVSRTALPIMARLAPQPDVRAQVLTWSLQRVAMLVAPLMAGVILVADGLMALIHDEQGRSYAAASLPLRLLAGAALLRVLAQVLSTAMLASGRPDLSARLSAIVFALLASGLLAVGATLPAQAGLVGAAALWLGIYPIVLLWGAGYLRRHWGIGWGSLARALRTPLAATLVMVAVVEAVRHYAGVQHPGVDLAIVSATVAACYAGIVMYEKKAVLF